MKGVFGTMAAGLVFVVLLAIVGTYSRATSTPSYRQKGWSHKAGVSAKIAARLVGGFSNEDVRAYKNGLAHISNEHLNPGAFTIAEVVDQENVRRIARDNAVQATRRAAQLAAQDRQAKADEATALARAKQQDHIMAASRAAEEDTIHGDPDCLVMDRKTESSSSDAYTATVAGIVKNTCNRDFRYVQVEVNFYKDDDTTQIGSGLANLNNLEAGNNWSFKAVGTGTGNEEYRYRVAKISGF